MATHDNLQLMQTLDDSWNNQDWDTFSKRHAEHTVVYWPGKPEPTRGVHDHKAESIEFFQTFPDNHIENRPYKVLIGQGNWTCSVAHFTGTMKGPMTGSDGKQIPPTNKSFAVDFCTVAHCVKANGLLAQNHSWCACLLSAREPRCQDEHGKKKPRRERARGSSQKR